MKIPCLILSALLLSGSCFCQEDTWDVYLAQYEKGAGSTVINMSLKERAPVKLYPYLLKVGVKLLSCTDEGLPSKEEFKTLYAISDKVKDKVDSLKKNKAAGTFSYQCSRTDYYYVTDTNSVRKVLQSMFKKYYPRYEYNIEIKSDPGWEAYLTFLYPNEETREYMENSKVTMKLTEAGDDLSKSRQVDHWLYFKTEADREIFIKYALSENFKVEGKEISKKSALQFQLHLSRTDKVNVGAISAVTIQLRRKAQALNGDYDGWETFVIK